MVGKMGSERDIEQGTAMAGKPRPLAGVARDRNPPRAPGRTQFRLWLGLLVAVVIATDLYQMQYNEGPGSVATATLASAQLQSQLGNVNSKGDTAKAAKSPGPIVNASDGLFYSKGFLGKRPANARVSTSVKCPDTRTTCLGSLSKGPSPFGSFPSPGRGSFSLPPCLPVQGCSAHAPGPLRTASVRVVYTLCDDSRAGGPSLPMPRLAQSGRASPGRAGVVGSNPIARLPQC